MDATLIKVGGPPKSGTFVRALKFKVRKLVLIGEIFTTRYKELMVSVFLVADSVCKYNIRCDASTGLAAGKPPFVFISSLSYFRSSFRNGSWFCEEKTKLCNLGARLTMTLLHGTFTGAASTGSGRTQILRDCLNMLDTATIQTMLNSPVKI